MPRSDSLYFPAPRGVLAVKGPGYYAIPTIAAGISLTPGTNAWGSYVQVTAGEPRPFYIVGVQLFLATPAADVSYAQIGIGLGASAVEVQISEFKLQSFDFVTAVGGGGYGTIMLPFPIPVPGGQRVAARAALAAGTTVVIVSLNVVAQDDLVSLA
jgi:hypothetical protein